jgi:CHAT domain
MLDQVQIITADVDLYELLQELLLSDVGGRPPLCSAVMRRVKTWEDFKPPIAEVGQWTVALIVDARIHACNSTSCDETGATTLDFLKGLRQTSSIPAIILVPHAMEEIDQYCANSRPDVCLTITNLSRDALEVNFERLGFREGDTAERHDVDVEIEIQPPVASYRVLNERGKQVSGDQIFIRNHDALSSLAKRFKGWAAFEAEKDNQGPLKPASKWRDSLESAGRVIFDNVMLDGPGRGYFNHLINSSAVHFRFRVSEDLFSVPFEALYDDKTSRFLTVISPVARLIQTSGSSDENEHALASRSDKLRMLFVLSQVRGTPNLVDCDGRRIADSVWFEPLANLAVEHQCFKRLAELERDSVEIEFFPPEGGTQAFHADLRALLTRKSYSLIHFAGHSYRSSDDRTYLVIPSATKGELIGLPIEVFARWVGQAGAVFVYLSSCRGSSAQSVQQLVYNGIPNVLAFRWDVEDDRAACFAKEFYSDLLSKKEPLAKAYRNACSRLHDDQEKQSPIWLSPVLVMQVDRWWSFSPNRNGKGLSHAIGA